MEYGILQKLGGQLEKSAKENTIVIENISLASFLIIFRFMWFCFTSIAAVTALVIIMSLWEKFQTNPTITGKKMVFCIYIHNLVK